MTGSRLAHVELWVDVMTWIVRCQRAAHGHQVVRGQRSAYGKPSDLPWAMAVPNGTIPTTVPVHPTALYEAVVAFALAVALWGLRKRLALLAGFGLYAVISGLARFLIEEIRINWEVVLGMTQPQVWSLTLVVIGVGTQEPFRSVPVTRES